MFENIAKFFKKLVKSESKDTPSKDTAKERLHLVLMQDRANVSADFLEMMKQEIIDVIKKYIEVEESEIDVRLTNEVKEDGTTGAPSLYANIPILNVRNDMKKEVEEKADKEEKNEDKQEKTDPKDKEENEEIKENTENNPQEVQETNEKEQKENNEKEEKTENEKDKVEET